MNLTNDNPDGCQQIAACGGLEVMSSLIAGHYPSFSSSSSHFKEIKKNGSHFDMDNHLTDQELDFLVAILGLLVNLVEKDGQNRLILLLSVFGLLLTRILGLLVNLDFHRCKLSCFLRIETYTVTFIITDHGLHQPV